MEAPCGIVTGTGASTALCGSGSGGGDGGGDGGGGGGSGEYSAATEGDFSPSAFVGANPTDRLADGSICHDESSASECCRALIAPIAAALIRGPLNDADLVTPACGDAATGARTTSFGDTLASTVTSERSGDIGGNPPPLWF